MNTRIATGIFAFAIMFATFAANAKADAPEDGVYQITNNSGDGVVAYKFRLEKVGTSGKSGVYVIHTGDGDAPAFLSAESSDDGAKVEFRGSKKTHWQLIENSNGWSLHHKDDATNCLSVTKNGLRLRRANADGGGNADQIWKLKAN